MATNKSFTTVNEVKNWRSALVNEDKARDAWYPKYGWMLDEYTEVCDKLKDLKTHREYIPKVEKRIDTRDPRPYPVTTNREYGWLASKAEFKLEVVGPYPNTCRGRVPSLY